MSASVEKVAKANGTVIYQFLYIGLINSQLEVRADCINVAECLESLSANVVEP